MTDHNSLKRKRNCLKCEAQKVTGWLADCLRDLGAAYFQANIATEWSHSTLQTLHLHKTEAKLVDCIKFKITRNPRGTESLRTASRSRISLTSLPRVSLELNDIQIQNRPRRSLWLYIYTNEHVSLNSPVTFLHDGQFLPIEESSAIGQQF